MKQLRMMALTMAAIFAMGSFLSGSRAQSSVEQEVLRHERALYDALIKKDFAIYASYLSDDYTEIRANGRVFTKEQVIQMGKRPGGKLERYDLDELKVRVHGDTAIITGKFSRKGTAMSLAGQPFDYDEQGRFTDVWVKKQGRWLCLANQDTFISQPSAGRQAQGIASAQGTNAAEQELLKTRREWLEAYYSGDTETLARIETSDFVVISDRVIENQRVYTTMQNAAKAGRWFPKGSANIDTEVRVRVQDGIAVVSGRGWDKIPGRVEEEPQHKKAFTELWVKRDGRWRIMHLHFDRQDLPRQPSGEKSQTPAPIPGQSAFPFGTYTAKDQRGTWVMSFRSDGTFTIKVDDRVIVPNGKYTIKNDQVVFSNEVETSLCGTGDGTYKWSFDGKTLTFGVVSDSNCVPRQSTLTGNKFIKQ